MKILILILLTFSQAWAIRPSPREVSCRGSQMIDSKTGQNVHRFTFEVDCKRALVEAHQTGGLYCDDRQLWDVFSSHWREYLFAKDCQKGLSQMNVESGYFCSDRDLVDRNNRTIHRFVFGQDCDLGLIQSRITQGMFCDRGSLLKEGKEIAIFSLSDSCRVGLRDIMIFSGRFCRDRLLMNRDGQRLKLYPSVESCRSALLLPLAAVKAI